MKNNFRKYIEDFVEDLNYQNVILYIGDVNHEVLLKNLEKDKVNKTYRLDHAIENPYESSKNFIYIENCDLQNLDYPIFEYLQEGYMVLPLRYDDTKNKFYVKSSFCWWFK